MIARDDVLTEARKVLAVSLDAAQSPNAQAVNAFLDPFGFLPLVCPLLIVSLLEQLTLMTTSCLSLFCEYQLTC